jgi:AcrR family transcriptional regulator
MPSTAAQPSRQPVDGEALASKSPGRARGRYSSDSMLARRQKMLDAAKRMIAEGGPEGFTIRELSVRAKVSITTIYATYGDKESLVAAAIGDYYQQLPLASAPAPTTLAEVLAANAQARAAIMANKPYARQYAELYFSRTVDPRIYNAIRRTASASAGQLNWFERVKVRGDMLDGLTMEEVAGMLASSRLSVLHDWVQGRVDDAELGRWSDRAFLMFARSITRGDTQAQVEAELIRLLAENRGRD